MWTNVFRIGGLQQVSWFQYLPSESQCSTLTEKSANIEEQKDTATLLVLSAHIRLQNRDFLSTWTNSFIGPWDPSQGIHNPDEKIKLWLFLPGRPSSINATAQAAVSGLKVVASGLWSAPGDSEEVAVAFSQALRNRIERAFNFRGLSYMRFGDVFVKCRSFGKNDIQFRKPLSTWQKKSLLGTSPARATPATSRGRGLPPIPLTSSSLATRAHQTPLPSPPAQAPASTSRGKGKAVAFSRKTGRGNQYD